MGRRQTIDPLVRAKVIDTWGNDCWLGLPGCTKVGAEDDHIVPYSHGGMDTVANIRRACKHCNASRQDRVLYGYGARLHMVIVPPGSCDREAVEWIDAHKSAGDPVVSFSTLATAMGLTNPSLACRRAVAMAWSGAYRQFATSAEPIDVWLTRTTISSNRHPRLLDEWIALDYDLHVIDPGFSVEWERAGRRDPPSCQAMVRAALIAGVGGHETCRTACEARCPWPSLRAGADRFAPEVVSLFFKHAAGQKTPRPVFSPPEHK